MNNLGSGGFSILPVVVKNLLIINGLMFLASIITESRLGIDLNHWLGLYYPASPYFKPYQLITHVFMHGNFMHLFFNMFSLWMFGSVLENYWGPKRFFVYYFVTAFGAAALHIGVNAYEIYHMNAEVARYAMNPNINDYVLYIQDHKSLINTDVYNELNRLYSIWSTEPANAHIAGQSVEALGIFTKAKMNIPVVGASGAVFGLLLAFGMLFPNTQLMMIFLPIPIKAKYFVMIYGALELMQGISSNPGDNVAHFAHLGGMLFGFILIKIWNKNRFRPMY
ncbi:MAG: rhomboid family intramembrane serine protease [Bacteroidota bacterium]|jgi:membrane associated rhomboid family serine protease